MRKITPAILLAALLAPGGGAPPRKVTDAEVAEVQRTAVLIDTHNDVTSRTVAGFDIGKPSAAGHTDIPRLRKGGVGAVFFAAYVAAGSVPLHGSARRALEMIDTVQHDIVERYPNEFAAARTAGEIEEARRAGKIAALIGIEGGHAIEDDLRLLRRYYALGVRYMTLTHINTNNWADSSGDIREPGVKHHNGLTEFGREVVREMNRLGMIVDISHVSDKTFWDVLETSRAPVFASHSSCRALCGHHRNMTDEMIVALAKKGGVIQINFYCGFLSQAAANADERLFAEARRLREEAYTKHKDQPEALRAEEEKIEAWIGKQTPRATLEDVVAHIDHVVKIAGIGAVGIGSDFDGISCAPRGLEDVSKFPALTRALLEKGYTAEDILEIYGGNTLRLMRAVEKSRAALAAPWR